MSFAGAGAINPQITVPLVKTPVQEGASGLHYSGQVYMNPQVQLAASSGSASDFCPAGTGSITPAQINDIMPGSISNPTLPLDDTTHRIQAAALQTYIATLTATGKIPAGPSPLSDNTNLTVQITADTGFYVGIQSEYCFYESRYKAALTQFLALAADSTQGTSTSTATAAALASTVQLNARLNSLLEILNQVGNSRAQNVNARSPRIATTNTSLNQQIGELNSQHKFFTDSDVVIRTQTEMVRYSAEKNRAMSIQIGFFVALNVLALGAVLTVYRKTG